MWLLILAMVYAVAMVAFAALGISDTRHDTAARQAVKLPRQRTGGRHRGTSR